MARWPRRRANLTCKWPPASWKEKESPIQQEAILPAEWGRNALGVCTAWCCRAE